MLFRSFANETSTGVYRGASGQFDIAVLGNKILGVTATGIEVTGNVSASGAGTFLNGIAGGAY